MRAHSVPGGTHDPVDSTTHPVVELRNVDAGYGSAQVLRHVSIAVAPSSVVALLGPNGAGKTTLLRVATGLLRPQRGQISLSGQDITGMPAYRIAKRGFLHVPEGRGVFASLSVKDNIILTSPRGHESQAIQRSAELFPVLGKRLQQTAGSLSGGERQMLALMRVIVRNPAVIAIDEASLGLSPAVVDKIYEVLRQIVDGGVSVLLVEQYVTRALKFADVAYVLNRGEIVHAGAARDVDSDSLLARYLGREAQDGHHPPSSSAQNGSS
jgi:branched-chain amino acid transport system ATP-binding protein